MRSPRRLFKAAGSRSGERGEFLSGSTRGQPGGKVIKVRFHLMKPSRPRANPSGEVGNRGARVHRGIIVPNDWFLAEPWWRSSQAALVRPSGSPARSAGLGYGAGTVWSPYKIVRIAHIIVCASQLAARTTTAQVGPTVDTDPAPPRAEAVWSGQPTSPRRCHPHHSGNSDRRSCPGGRQTLGCATSVSRAGGTPHATRGPAASAVDKRSARAPRPGGCPHALPDSRSPA